MSNFIKLHRPLRTVFAAKDSVADLARVFLPCSTLCKFQSYSNPHLNKFSTEAKHKKVINPGEKELINPLKHPDFFGVKQLVTLEDLFNARVHYGHKKGSRNEHMKPYLYGCRLDVDIIDLDQTLSHLHIALNFLAHISFRQGIILFLMKSQQYGHLVEQLALECGEYAHTRSWLEGTFTNKNKLDWEEVRLPDVCVFLSVQGEPYKSHAAVAEAAKVGIVSVGVCDTNVNPTIISYPIPGNDDSLTAIELYCKLFKQAILLGKSKRKELDEDNSVKIVL